jgi:O-antigen ligase
MDLTKTQYPTLSTPLIVLFNLLVVSWWLEIGLRVSFLAAIRFEFLLAATLSVIALVRHRSQPRSRTVARTRSGEGNSDITRCIVIYLVVLTLSLPLSINFDLSWNAFFNRVAKLALLGALISQFVVSPTTLRYYLFALLMSFMKIGQEAFLGRITGSMVWENQGVPRLHGTSNTMFGDPNSLAGKTVSTVPFMWYLFPTVQRRWVKILIAVQLVFAINIIIFAASRTGYLTFIAAAILIVLFAKRGKAKLILLLIMAAFITVSYLPQEYQGRFMSSFTGQEAEGASSATRKALFFDSMGAFADNPLGIGLGCFPTYQAIRGRNAQETHNLYTQILAETGIQGFICFVALLYVVLRKALRTRRAFSRMMDDLELHLDKSRETLGPELRDAKLLFATTTALIVFVFVRLTLGFFGHDFLEIYWWFAAGLTMSLHNMRETAEKRCTELISQAKELAQAKKLAQTKQLAQAKELAQAKS